CFASWAHGDGVACKDLKPERSTRDDLKRKVASGDGDGNSLWPYGIRRPHGHEQLGMGQVYKR
ncbi:hypothetical protein EJB05_01758, partial [Eragrostis curvula]